MSHADARQTPAGRRLSVERSEVRTIQAEVARQIALSRGTVVKWQCLCDVILGLDNELGATSECAAWLAAASAAVIHERY